MQVRFTKTTPTHHQFEIVRTDGSHEEILLETKSFMPHDLIHFAYEREAGCKNSFYGLLAAGKTFAEMDDRTLMSNPALVDSEMVLTEKIVGPLTAYLGTDIPEEAFLDMLKNMFEASGKEVPSHITPSFLISLKKNYRALIGEWNSLPHHTKMEILW